MTPAEPTSTPPTPDSNDSCRRVLTSAAALAAAGLAGWSGGDGSEATDPATEEPTTMPGPDPVTADVPMLTYAVTLEHPEKTISLRRPGDRHRRHIVADVLADYGDELRMSVPDLEAVAAHEPQLLAITFLLRVTLDRTWQLPSI